MRGTSSPDPLADELMERARGGGLQPLRLGGRTLLPVVQGGMGMGVSAHGLAGSVAALGAMGTISSVDLRRHHPDLMARTPDLPPGQAATQAAKQAINAANLEALGREIRAARALSGGRGRLAVNVMRAVGEYAPSVMRAACSCWCASGSAGSACPTPSSSNTRGWPVATWARRGSPTWPTRASTSRTSFRSRWLSCAAPASKGPCR